MRAPQGALVTLISMNNSKNTRVDSAASKNKVSKTKISVLAAISLLAACSATAVSFMERAQDFAMGTWTCSAYGPFVVGVKPDGTALFQGESDTVYQLTWSLEGGELRLNGPAGSDSSADIGIADLENGAISHTDTSGDDGTFIGGEPGTLSNVKWDFEKRTVSFQSQADSFTPGDVVECRKTSDVVDLKPSVVD